LRLYPDRAWFLDAPRGVEHLDGYDASGGVVVEDYSGLVLVKYSLPLAASAMRDCRTSRSDIDLMVVSDKLTYADLFGALEPLAARLGRVVNPTVYSRRELAKRIKEGNAFAKRVLGQPKVWVIGTEHDLGA